MYNANGNQKRKKTVLVGMTGRADSTAAAHLLKMQGYNVLGITVSFIDPKAMSKHGSSGIYGRCHVSDLDQVAKICKDMEIPFYAVRAHDVFKSEVLDWAVAARLGGRTFYPCAFCDQIKFDILLKKAELLKADYIATGHYAKVQYNQHADEYHLLAGSDPKNDQAYTLARLSQKHLSKMILPVGGMREAEVNRIADSLGLDLAPKDKFKEVCFRDNDALVKYVEKNAAPSLREDGTINRLSDDTFVADHHGIHNYHHGQKNLVGTGVQTVDPNYEVVKIDAAKKTVYVGAMSDFSYNFCDLTHFYTDTKLNTSTPMTAFARYRYSEPKVPCTVYFKNNGIVSLEFHERREGMLMPGQYIALFTKGDDGGKVIGSGLVNASGRFYQLDRVFVRNDEEDDEYLNEEEKAEREKKKKRKPEFIL